MKGERHEYSVNQGSSQEVRPGRDGLTIVEYAVAGGLITGAVVLAFTALGGAVQAEIERLTDAITDN